MTNLINPRELRIGNYIIDVNGEGYSNKGQIVKVTSISDGGCNQWQDMGASGQIKNIQPIPLTPEILENDFKFLIGL